MQAHFRVTETKISIYMHIFVILFVAFRRLEYPRLKLDTLLFVKVLCPFIYFSCEVTNVGYRRFYRLPAIKNNKYDQGTQQ